MAKADTLYVVSFTVLVDRPELRGETLPVVPAGKYLPQRVTTPSYSSAVSLFEGILSGEEDFSSEYVKAVQVWSEDLRTGERRTVRRFRRRRGRESAWAAEG